MEKIELEYMPVWRRYLEQLRSSGLRKRDLAILMMAMMEYHFEGKEPKRLNRRVKVFWAIYRPDLDYARERYETSVKNGKKGGRKKKQNPEKTQQNPEEGITITKTITESEPITKSKAKAERKKSASGKAEVSVLKHAYGEYGWIQLTDREYAELKQEMGKEQLQQCIAYIDESAQSTGNRNHWLDWHAVLRRCYQKRWHEASYGKQEIPKGASGHLGEAELEAIRRVLAT